MVWESSRMIFDKKIISPPPHSPKQICTSWLESTLVVSVLASWLRALVSVCHSDIKHSPSTKYTCVPSPLLYTVKALLELNMKSPHRLTCLNPWSVTFGTIWEGCGTFRRWSLAEGNGSLRARLGGVVAPLHFPINACNNCKYNTTSSFTPAAMLSHAVFVLPWWIVAPQTVSQNQTWFR